MESRFEITTSMLGQTHVERGSCFEPTLRWTDDGVTYEPDQRHAELIVKEFDLCGGSNIGDDTHGRRNANPVKTPAVPENHLMEEKRECSEPMGRPDALRYQARCSSQQSVPQPS